MKSFPGLWRALMSAVPSWRTAHDDAASGSSDAAPRLASPTETEAASAYQHRRQVCFTSTHLIRIAVSAQCNTDYESSVTAVTASRGITRSDNFWHLTTHICRKSPILCPMSQSSIRNQLYLFTTSATIHQCYTQTKTTTHTQTHNPYDKPNYYHRSLV